MKSARTLKPMITAIALLGVATPAWVHHSGAMFDPGKEQTIAGTIAQFNWTNPHSSFKVAVPGADGKEEIWAIEMNSPQNLIPLGWKRTTLKQGDKVTVVVHPLRDGKPGGSYVSITLADGTKLSGSGPGQRDAYPAPAAGAPTN
jgi:hypothetical protein